MPIALRTQRTEARLLPAQKKRIERAASLRGLSVSDFIVQNADEAAVRTIREHEAWILQDADRDAFIQALLNPRGPSVRMKAAVKRYRQRSRKQ